MKKLWEEQTRKNNMVAPQKPASEMNSWELLAREFGTEIMPLPVKSSCDVLRKEAKMVAPQEPLSASESVEARQAKSEGQLAETKIQKSPSSKKNPGVKVTITADGELKLKNIPREERDGKAQELIIQDLMKLALKYFKTLPKKRSDSAFPWVHVNDVLNQAEALKNGLIKEELRELRSNGTTLIIEGVAWFNRDPDGRFSFRHDRSNIVYYHQETLTSEQHKGFWKRTQESSPDDSVKNTKEITESWCRVIIDFLNSSSPLFS